MPGPLAVLGLGLTVAGLVLLDFTWRRRHGAHAAHGV